MPNRFLVIIETESAFVQEFQRQLMDEDVRQYVAKQIVPEFINGRRNMIEKCLNEVKAIDSEEIAAFFVDLVIGSSVADNKGVDIGMALRKVYPDKPVFCITHRSRYEHNLDNMSEATLEDFDGVFEKGFLTGQDFSEARLEKMLAKAGAKRAMYNPDWEKPAGRKGKNSGQRPLDIAIITALFEKEFEQVKKFVDIDKELSGKTGVQSTKIGRIKGTNLTAVIDYQQKMGQVDAAALATTALSRYQPKLLIMAGVCGGREAKGVAVGDIVIPQEVYDYQTGKLDKGQFKPYGYRVRIDENLISKAREWQQEIIRQMEDYSDLSKERIRDTDVHFDIMASGTLVLKTDDSLDHIAETRDEKTVAVEMESYGIARACEMLPYRDRTKAIIIKAAMDGANAEKNDDNKEWAAYISSSFVYHFVKKLENEGYFE